MIKQNLVQGFLNSVSTNKQSDGKRILNNELVSDVDIDYNDNSLELNTNANIISENLYNVYKTSITIDISTFNVINTKCTCLDFEKNELRKKNYGCKHICALFFSILENMDSNLILKRIFNNYKTDNIKKEKDILDIILPKQKSEKVKLEIYINKNSWNNKIGAEFKIGLTNMKSSSLYTLKDIDSFLVNKYNHIPIRYGKAFTFDSSIQNFTDNDLRLIKFIEMLKEIDIHSNHFRKSQDRYVNGKEIVIPKSLIRNFFEIIEKHRVYLNNGFYSRKIDTEVIVGDIPLPIDLRTTDEGLNMEFLNGIPEELSENSGVFIYNTIIYIPSENQYNLLKPYLNLSMDNNMIRFNKAQEERVYKELIPSLTKLTNSLSVDKKISDKIIIAPAKFRLYLDRNTNTNINLKLNVLYRDVEFNIFGDIKEKIVYRDYVREQDIINKLKVLGFNEDNGNFILNRSDDQVYKFLKEDIHELQEIGEVFYSEDFKGILKVSKNDFSVQVSRGREDYLEFKYSISNISESEYFNIIKSFKENKKYIKLKDGEFIDLEEVELKEFLRLLSFLSNDKELKESNTIEVTNGKGLYLRDKLNTILDNEYEGKDLLDTMKFKLDKLSKKSIGDIPNLKTKLRDYQLYGVRWLEELSYLGLGGILGDEMGLGKTIQTISFILRQDLHSPALIVAPTSLIYNWMDEFNKFAPSLKVKIVNQSRKDRIEILNSYMEYDVIITTYNLLRLDLDYYRKINFSSCFLDEAQFIKNPSALNTKACKKINAKNKFALTGTPIENNLLELWSIFDFIMPGFLFSKEEFNSKFNRNLMEEDIVLEELKRLISPFILRRLKKDVIKELPDKIEKVIKVDMTKEQRKIYASYAKYAKDIIDKKVENSELQNSKIEVLSYITKLRQICLDPSLVMKEYLGTSGKLEALMEIIYTMIEKKQKVLIFSQFTSMLGIISDMLTANNINYYYLDGSLSSIKRQELVKSFNNDSTNIFLISLKAGGTGLNLTSANVVIHFDPWWNPAVENQATDRAHRIGQKNVVEVIKLVAKGTIEEKIINLQNKKNDLIQNLIGEEHIKNDLFSNLSTENIIELFSK